MVLGKNGSPHKSIRVCKHCRQKKHDHIPKIGNSDRFHGQSSFCNTHRTTVIGRLYCNMSGKPRTNVSPQLRKRRAALIRRLRMKSKSRKNKK